MWLLRETVSSDYVRLAEEMLSSYLGVRHSLLTSMGRTALVVALKALGVTSGDNVVTPAFACDVVARAIAFCGARPVFADVDPLTFNIKPEEIEKRITTNTKAVIVIHCYGQPGDMNEILEISEKHNVPVIEDCAHSLGAEYHGKRAGNFGHFSIFSFSKNMNCSSGGALATNSDEMMANAQEILGNLIARRKSMSRLRHLIERKFVDFARRERSSLASLKLSELARLDMTRKLMNRVSNKIPSVFSAHDQLTIEVIGGLRTIDQKNEGRREKGQFLTELINDMRVSHVQAPSEKKDRSHVYYIYGLKVKERKKMLKKLRKLEKHVHYGLPWRCSQGVEARKLSKQLLEFEMEPDLTEEHLHSVVSALA